MLKSAEKTGTNEYSIALTISAEAFEKAIVKAYNKEKNNIAMPGFRKGKAPRAMIEKKYGANIFYEDALEIAFPEAFDEACKEAGVTPVANPFDFDVVSMGPEGAELTLKVIVKPDITIEGYKGIEAVKPALTVTDEEVEADIARKLEQNARIVPVEDKPVENGNIAVIDFEGFVDDVAFEGGKAEMYELEIGSGSFIPGFEEQIIGHVIGDEFDVNVTFPEEYAEELAGKAAVFKIKLHEIKAKEIPEADDDFASETSEFETMAEYKESIRKTLAESKEKSAESSFKNAVYDKLAELVTDEIPEAMYETAVNNMIDEFRYNVESQGIPFEQYLGYLGMSIDSMKQTYRPRAEADVKIELALDKIAVLEGFEVTAEEIEAEFNDIAAKYSVEVDKVKAVYAEDYIKTMLLKRKADSFVIDNAVAVEAAKEETEETPKKKTAAKKPAAKKTTKKKAEAAEAEEPKTEESAE